MPKHMCQHPIRTTIEPTSSQINNLLSHLLGIQLVTLFRPPNHFPYYYYIKHNNNDKLNPARAGYGGGKV